MTDATMKCLICKTGNLSPSVKQGGFFRVFECDAGLRCADTLRGWPEEYDKLGWQKLAREAFEKPHD